MHATDDVSRLFPSITPQAAGWLAYVGVFVLLGLSIPSEVFSPDSHKFLLIVGGIAVWRYGWALVHGARAVLYLSWRFPDLRARAEALGDRGLPGRVFVVVTSYREHAHVTLRVFDALFREAAACGTAVTVVAVVTDPAEQGALEMLAERLRLPESVDLVTLRQDGSGKRAALAEGLRAVARRLPPADAVTVVMDGDTLVPPGTLRRCTPFFRLLPDLGGLTTDARGSVGGSAWGADWYAARYAQRHLLMASLSLSGRLLVLTGRLSLLRTSLTVRPDFIAQVEHDSLDHWRYGRFRFVTGDDKSTWFWLLRHGWRMMYVPDVAIRTLEHFPRDRFLAQSVGLMSRWFGNMLRNNGRALRLGPWRTGPFLWWCLADQRLSVWTSLTGPTFALLWFLQSAWALPVYVFWVMATRFVQALVVGLAHPGALTPRTPLLLYHTQVVGALVKAHVGFRLNRQKWGRQQPAASPRRRQDAAWDAYLTTMAAAVFIAAAAWIADVVSWPDFLSRAAMAASWQDRALPPAQAARLQEMLDTAPAGGMVRLAAGDFPVAAPLLIRRDDITLAGAGPGRTRLVASFPAADAAVIEVVGEAVPRRCVDLGRPAGEQDTVIDVSGTPPPPGSTVMLTAANDASFLDGLGARVWRRAQPELRRTLGEVAGVRGRQVYLSQPLGVDLPAGARLCSLALRRGVRLEGLSVVYDIGGAPDPSDYSNARPGHLVDGIRVRGALRPHLADLEVLHAGRHPLALDTVLAPRVERLRLVGAWNKGPGGNGYLRLTRVVRGRLQEVAAIGLRHVVLQWSTHDTVLGGLRTDADVNFHGGFSRRNRVEAAFLAPRPGHPWPAVVTTPVDAAWAPPDGPGNQVIAFGGPP